MTDTTTKLLSPTRTDRCRSCGDRFSNHDDASRESPTRPGACGGCDGHLTEIEDKTAQGYQGGSMSWARKPGYRP